MKDDIESRYPVELIDALGAMDDDSAHDMVLDVFDMVYDQLDKKDKMIDILSETADGYMVGYERNERVLNKLHPLFSGSMPTIKRLYSAFCQLNTHQIYCNYTQENGTYCNCGVSDLRVWMDENYDYIKVLMENKDV